MKCNAPFLLSPIMYDDTCKFIAANFSVDLASWLLGETIELTVLEPTELYVEPIRADSVVFLQSKDIILHIEFQTSPNKDLPFRVADYYLRIYRCFPDKTIYQVVIYLKKTTSNLAKITTFQSPKMTHNYNVIRLWEVPTQQLLQAPGLLPFAVLSQTENPVEVLEDVGKRIENISDKTQRSNLAAASSIIAGLVLDKIVIDTVLREEVMRESVVYQDILAKGEARGKAEGRKQEAVNLILRQLNRRIGEIDPNLTARIQELPVEELENLAEALLDFQNEADLVKFLER